MSFPLRFALLVPAARLTEAGTLASRLFGDPPEDALGNFSVPLKDASEAPWRGGSGVAADVLAEEATAALADAPWARLALWTDEEGALLAAVGFEAPPEGTAWGWDATLAALGLRTAWET